jgi:hypothetical protein
MQTLVDLIRREPVLSQGVVQAIFACAATFGLPMSQQQLGGLLALSAASLALLARSHTTSVAHPRTRGGADLVPSST